MRVRTVLAVAAVPALIGLACAVVVSLDGPVWASVAMLVFVFFVAHPFVSSIVDVFGSPPESVRQVGWACDNGNAFMRYRPESADQMLRNGWVAVYVRERSS